MSVRSTTSMVCWRFDKGTVRMVSDLLSINA